MRTATEQRALGYLEDEGSIGPVLHVPPDYDGPVGMCRSCGWPAPARPAYEGSQGPTIVQTCSSCFIGQFAGQIRSSEELQDALRELGRWHEDGPTPLPQ